MPQTHSNMGKKIAAGAGLAAAAAAALGAYFLYGSKNALKNRKKVKGWMLKAKGEILEQLENLSEVTEEAYHKVVGEVAKKYQQVKDIDKKDVEAFVGEVKKHWKELVRDMKPAKKRKK